MKLGVLKDIKKEEYRVILTPSEVENIIQDGHQVLVERSAANGPGFRTESTKRWALCSQIGMRYIESVIWLPRSRKLTRLSILCCARDRSYLPASIRRPIPRKLMNC